MKIWFVELNDCEKDFIDERLESLKLFQAGYF